MKTILVSGGSRLFGGILKKDLWTSNVDGTRNVAEVCRANSVRSVAAVTATNLFARRMYQITPDRLTWA